MFVCVVMKVLIDIYTQLLVSVVFFLLVVLYLHMVVVCESYNAHSHPLWSRVSESTLSNA